MQTIVSGVATQKTPSNSSQFSSLTDSELYMRCKEFGKNARVWTRKFGGLLPEVFHRRLYKKRGCASIHEFAAKLAGINHETVDKILHLAEILFDKPTLLSLLETGEVGWSKIQTVAYIATANDEMEWAKKIVNLPARALEVYVKEVRANRLKSIHVDELQNTHVVNQVANFFERGDNCFILPDTHAAWNRLSFLVDPKTERELRVIKQKMEKDKKEALGWNEVMKEFIKLYNMHHPAPKTRKQTAELRADKIKEKANIMEEFGSPGRNIPAEIKKFINERCKRTCEFPGCNQPAKIYHHTRRYALRHNHDPDFIVALCAPHERLAHSGLVANETSAPAKWELLREPDHHKPEFRIDKKVGEYRAYAEHPQ